MKLFLLALPFFFVGCTDAKWGSMTAYGESAHIVCYSGGARIFTDRSTGKVQLLEGGGWHYVSAASGNYVRTFADCFVEVEK